MGDSVILSLMVEVSDETVFCHSSSFFTGGVCCSLPNKGRFQKQKELIEGVKKKQKVGSVCMLVM
jgi:hypothetical protein